MLKTLLLFILAGGLLACSQDSFAVADASAGGTGVGGSLARFTIVGQYLYTLDASHLSWFELDAEGKPNPRGQLELSEGQETIFPLHNYLLLGAVDGLSIFEIQADGRPQFVSRYQHIRSCDPVVADERFAYVTLRASGCSQAAWGAADLLEVISLENIEDPQVLASYNLQNPRGLGLDGNLLFVCDGPNGLKVFDATHSPELTLLQEIDNIFATDVIPLNGLLLVIGPDNIYQYDYRTPGQLVFVSQIPLGV